MTETDIMALSKQLLHRNISLSLPRYLAPLYLAGSVFVVMSFRHAQLAKLFFHGYLVALVLFAVAQAW